MNTYIEKENIKLGPQGTDPFVTEEKPTWRQEQQSTFGKALGVAEQLATVMVKYLTSEWNSSTKYISTSWRGHHQYSCYPLRQGHLWRQQKALNCWVSRLTNWSWLAAAALFG